MKYNLASSCLVGGGSSHHNSLYLSIEMHFYNLFGLNATSMIKVVSLSTPLSLCCRHTHLIEKYDP